MRDAMNELKLLATMLSASVALGACSPEPKVQVVWEKDEEKTAEPEGQSEEDLRAAYEQRLKDRENAPEPKLNPEEPREKGALVWRMGKAKLESIYGERAEMIAMLKRLKLEDRALKKFVKGWIPPLTEFGIGRDLADMERAPQELCALIEKVREPIDAYVTTGQERLKELSVVEKKLEERQAAGEEIYQKEWDKLDEQRKEASRPVTASKRILLVVKSMLEEAYVLADLGPRRIQISLRDCLTKVAEKPLPMDMAQDQLTKVIKRAKWYRDLR